MFGSGGTCATSEVSTERSSGRIASPVVPSFGEERLIHFSEERITGSPRASITIHRSIFPELLLPGVGYEHAGFQQNIRNGNSFVVINSEVRVPIFRYLLNRPIKSDFIRNLQVVGFWGYRAWNGARPTTLPTRSTTAHWSVSHL